MKRLRFILPVFLIALSTLAAGLSLSPVRAAPEHPAPATYRVASLGPAIGVSAVAAGGRVFGTVATGPGTQSAAYMSPAAPSTLVPTGYAWSEAVGLAGSWEAVNAQSSPGKSFGLRRTAGGSWGKLSPAAGHTAAKALKIDTDGTAYGWSLGKVGGAATFCAVTWKPGVSAPTILRAGNSEALGSIPGGVLVRVRKTGTQTGALLAISSDGSAAILSSGDVVGAVAVGGQAVGAVLAGEDLRPVLWSGGAQTILTPPPAGQSAVALTRAGSVAYGYRTALGNQYAAYWDQSAGGAMTDLPSPSGLALRTVAAVGPGGELVGMGNDSQGNIVAWIGVPG